MVGGGAHGWPHVVVMDGAGSCASGISAMVGCELELWGEGGHVVHDGVWRVCAAEWILVCVWFVLGGGGEGECVAMVAVAYLRCDGSGGGSVNDGEQGCEDDGGGE